MFRLLFAAALMLGCGLARAEYKPPPRADKLPQFDVLCYRNFVSSFVESGDDQIMEPSYDKEARFRLCTVDGLTLKVIRNPESEWSREEWGHMAPEINISMIADPSKRPPIFGWRENRDSKNEVFMYHAGDKILTLVKMTNLRGSRINSVEVMSCIRSVARCLGEGYFS
jgi:hypothetical protein